jgi:protein-disulfide isomerase-like protein with CxxC motif
MGVTGFPTLLASDGARLLLLTHGYRPLAQVESLLAAAARRFEHPDSGTGGEQPSMGAGPD